MAKRGLIQKVNNQLYKLEDLYADNIISSIELNKLRAKVLKSIENDNDLAYDDEINQIYRISIAAKHWQA